MTQSTEQGDECDDFFARSRRQTEAARTQPPASEGLVTDAIERVGPNWLYGAVGIAMFKADLGGLRIDQKIDLVGNAAFAALQAQPSKPVIGVSSDVEGLVEQMWTALCGQGVVTENGKWLACSKDEFQRFVRASLSKGEVE